MTTAETNEIASIVKRVQHWPTPVRVVLARRILETLENAPADDLSTKLPRGPSAAEIAAMFKTGKPVPSDEEVQRMLEEELMRKYGS